MKLMTTAVLFPIDHCEDGIAALKAAGYEIAARTFPDEDYLFCSIARAIKPGEDSDAHSSAELRVVSDIVKPHDGSADEAGVVDAERYRPFDRYQD